MDGFENILLDRGTSVVAVYRAAVEQAAQQKSIQETDLRSIITKWQVWMNIQQSYVEILGTAL